MRKADDQQFGLWPCLLYRSFELPQKTCVASKRNATKITARQDHGKLMDWIGRTGAQHNVSGVHNRPRQMRQRLFGTNSDDRFTIGIEDHLVAPFVPIADSDTELVNASRDGVAM